VLEQHGFDQWPSTGSTNNIVRVAECMVTITVSHLPVIKVLDKSLSLSLSQTLALV
jgi:hypothetical protein